MKSASRLFAVALVLCAVIRIGFVLFPRTSLNTKAIESISDAREYVSLAQSLATHHTFSRDAAPPFRPELFRTPAYPLLLSVVSFVHRTSFIVALALVVQLLLALAAVWLTRRLGLELGLGPAAASLAALLVALSPNLAFLSSKLVSENLFLPLLLVCLLLLNRYRMAGRVIDLVGVGASCGLLILTRPIATFFPLVIAIYILWRKFRIRNWQLGVRNSALVVACASVVVAPWVIRNGTLTGRYIISTASEHNLYLYNAATVLATEKGVTFNQARDMMMAEALLRFGSVDTNDEASMWQKLAQVAGPHFYGRPAQAAKVTAIGFTGNFVVPVSPGPLLVHSGVQSDSGTLNVMQAAIGLAARGKLKAAWEEVRTRRLSGVPAFAFIVLVCACLFHLLLMVFGLIGLFLVRGRNLLWLLLPTLYFTLLTGPVGEARFRAPIEPLLCLFAALALTRPHPQP